MTIAYYKVLDHEDQGIALFIDQFKGKPRLEAWAKAYLRQVQKLENASWDVLLLRFLDSAVGVHLDVIGRLVGELRQDRDDTTYRRFIRARVRINRSKGNTVDVLDVLGIITTTPLHFKEFQPAALWVQLDQIADEDPVLLYGQLRDTKAGGVKLTLIVPTTNTLAAMPMTYNGTTDADHAVGDANTTAPQIDGAAEPFVLADGMTLLVTIKGNATTMMFDADDFAVVGAATAAEVAAVWNRDQRRSGARAFDVAGVIRLVGAQKGTRGTIEVTGGTANTALGFSNVAVAGTGDTTFGFLADAVTMRDPSAPPVVRPIGPPVILSVTPDETPEDA